MQEESNLTFGKPSKKCGTENNTIGNRRLFKNFNDTMEKYNLEGTISDAFIVFK